MTRRTSEEVEALRDRIYSLALRCFSEREIAKAVGISKMTVHHHLMVLRERNLGWFDANKDPDGRNRSFHKELADQLKEVIKETWILYNQALKAVNALIAEGKHPSFAGCNALLHTILAALQQLRLHLRIIAPSPDQVFLMEQFKTVREQQDKLEEKMQAAKVHPL